ncbi:MAG: sugar ABC transporter permease [Chloroflexota bacterium]
MSNSVISPPIENVKPTVTQRIASRRTAGKRKDFKQDTGTGYLFIAPWLFGFFLFSAIPIAISLWLAFTNYDIFGNWQYVGLDNFQRMFFQDVRYGHALSATFKFVAIGVPLRLIFALGIAVLMNTHRRGVSFYRAAFYAPSIIGGSVAVAVMWRQLFGSDGLFNAVIGGLGIPPTNWLGNPQTAIWTLILLSVWQFGSPMLIFLAGLKQIPAELYEAASIDGANGWRKFLRITLPLLTPIIFFNLILQLIGGFKVFTQAFIITGGTPLDTTLFYSLYLYQRAFNSYELGYASAMAWVLLAIIAVLTAISFKLSSFWVFYESKEG